MIETDNIVSVSIKKERFPDTEDNPNPYWNEANNTAVFEDGYIVQFLMIGGLPENSTICNTKAEAEAKLKEWVGGINGRKR